MESKGKQMIRRILRSESVPPAHFDLDPVIQLSIAAGIDSNWVHSMSGDG